MLKRVEVSMRLPSLRRVDSMSFIKTRFSETLVNGPAGASLVLIVPAPGMGTPEEGVG
jgi:hypothetical protein